MMDQPRCQICKAPLIQGKVLLNRNACIHCYSALHELYPNVAKQNYKVDDVGIERCDFCGRKAPEIQKIGRLTIITCPGRVCFNQMLYKIRQVSLNRNPIKIDLSKPLEKLEAVMISV